MQIHILKSVDNLTFSCSDPNQMNAYCLNFSKLTKSISQTKL